MDGTHNYDDVNADRRVGSRCSFGGLNPWGLRVRARTRILALVECPCTLLLKTAQSARLCRILGRQGRARAIVMLRGSQWTLTGICLSASLLFAGCAFNGTGVVRSSVIETDRAFIVTVDSFGLQIRTVQFDSGFSVGYSRRTYLYPPGQFANLVPGEYWGNISLPDKVPVAIQSTVLGLGGRTGVPDFGVSLGYRSVFWLTPIPIHSDKLVVVDFRPNNLEETEIIQIEYY